MKRFILMVFILISIISCNSNKIYTLEYVVFYPNYNDTITISNDDEYYWSSDRGTTYIKEGSITGSTVYKGSAPYKILSYTSKQKEK